MANIQQICFYFSGAWDYPVETSETDIGTTTMAQIYTEEPEMTSSKDDDDDDVYSGEVEDIFADDEEDEDAYNGNW